MLAATHLQGSTGNLPRGVVPPSDRNVDENGEARDCDDVIEGGGNHHGGRDTWGRWSRWTWRTEWGRRANEGGGRKGSGRWRNAEVCISCKHNRVASRCLCSHAARRRPIGTASGTLKPTTASIHRQLDSQHQLLRKMPRCLSVNTTRPAVTHPCRLPSPPSAAQTWPAPPSQGPQL